MVTENGMACKDQLTVNEDGTKSVHDPDRIDYLKRHFAAAKRAIDEGVPLTGYFVWSLLDNFEWYFGYAKRFGITYVDYATQERIPRTASCGTAISWLPARAERPAIAVARCSMNGVPRPFMARHAVFVAIPPFFAAAGFCIRMLKRLMTLR